MEGRHQRVGDAAAAWDRSSSTAIANWLHAIHQRMEYAGLPLKVMVSLEMLAYTSPSQNYPHPAMRAVFGDRGDFIALVANAGRFIPDVRLSDHSPFWDQGYNALTMTDTSFMRNPHYHRMSDMVETLDLPFFCGVVEVLAEALG